MMRTRDEILATIAGDDELLEVGRKAIEDVLIALRDSRISMPGRGNGLVISERDGQASHIIRMGPEDALRVGLNAIAKRLVGEREEGRRG